MNLSVNCSELNKGVVRGQTARATRCKLVGYVVNVLLRGSQRLRANGRKAVARESK